MPSAKHWCNGMGLISSLFNVTLIPETYLFADCSSHLALASIVVLPLSSFVPVFSDNARCRFAMHKMVSHWLFWSDMDSLQRSFLHCYSSVTLCNERSIAKCFQCMINYLGACYGMKWSRYSNTAVTYLNRSVKQF